MMGLNEIFPFTKCHDDELMGDKHQHRKSSLERMKSPTIPMIPTYTHLQPAMQSTQSLAQGSSIHQQMHNKQIKEHTLLF